MSQKEAVSDAVGSKERAESILDFLDTYHYGTLRHALFARHVGCRISGAIAFDLDDFNPASRMMNCTSSIDRSGDALKNGTKSERNVTLRDSVTTILNDYIAVHREESIDDQGRDPLFTSLTGRLKRQHVYREVTSYSRPGTLGKGCPHDRKVEDCVAARQEKKAFECPSRTALHSILGGVLSHAGLLMILGALVFEDYLTEYRWFGHRGVILFGLLIAADDAIEHAYGSGPRLIRWLG